MRPTPLGLFAEKVAYLADAASEGEVYAQVRGSVVEILVRRPYEAIETWSPGYPRGSKWLAQDDSFHSIWFSLPVIDDTNAYEFNDHATAKILLDHRVTHKGEFD